MQWSDIGFVGWVQVAIKAGVPVIPVFTQNIKQVIPSVNKKV
jgi:hypothetical protein